MAYGGMGDSAKARFLQTRSARTAGNGGKSSQEPMEIHRRGRQRGVNRIAIIAAALGLTDRITLLCWGEAVIQKHLVQLQQAFGVQRAQQSTPGIRPNAFLLPLLQTPPAACRRRKLVAEEALIASLSTGVAVSTTKRRGAWPMGKGRQPVKAGANRPTPLMLPPFVWFPENLFGHENLHEFTPCCVQGCSAGSRVALFVRDREKTDCQT